ncbi:MAG: hypothetical protein HZB66_03120, partial [Candidatus Aenigmarchaeota archaeon]|nr:hypothetical protein [Candidatus Aenigmarchaeota archaeon]
SEEASISLRQLNAGIKTEITLDDFGKRTGSKLVKRGFAMLLHSMNTNSLNKLSAVAEDILKFFEISRERSSLLGMQKYTMLFGGLLIPLILKTALSLISGMGGLLSASSLVLVHTAENIVPLYLTIYGLLVSYYISEIEEKESLVPIYFVLLVAAGVIIFSVFNI